MQPSAIRTIIVDDEPPARDRLRELLADVPGVDVVGEAGDGPTATETILALAPDLVFLDIQLPGYDGFDVLRSLGTQQMPVVVFVTAYDQYALRAFEVHAVDYLLKPFDRMRLLQAVQHVRAQVALIRNGIRPANVTALLDGAPETVRNRFVVRSGGRTVFVDADDVDWIEAADNSVRLHCGESVHVLRETMTSIERSLDAARFVRIHRSALVRVDAIREVQPWFNGELVVLLASGAKVTTGRTYRHKLQALLTR